MCLLFYRIIDIKILSCCGIFMDLIFITKTHKLIFRIIRLDAVRPCVYYRNIFLACVTLRHKTSNYLKISSNTPSKGLTCHHLWCLYVPVPRVLWQISPMWPNLTPHITHHMSHTTHNTKYSDARRSRAASINPPFKYPLCSGSLFGYDAKMSSDIPQLF